MAGWTTKLVLLDCLVVKKGLPGNGEAFLFTYGALNLVARAGNRILPELIGNAIHQAVRGAAEDAMRLA